MSAIHTYLLYGLQATPVVLARLMQNVSPESENHRFDPDRFTLREVIAHLSDLENVWDQRISAILAEEGALFEGRDPDEFMKTENFSSTSATEFLQRFQDRRARLVKTLTELPESAWDKYGTHSQMGAITIHEMMQFVLGHDGYHVQQVAEWTDSK